jgi:acyl-CoA synthetase (NDP forming)
MTDLAQTIRSIDEIFNARSLALVGASNVPEKMGCLTLQCLCKSGYEGRIYPVNPRGGLIQGLTAYPTLKAIPELPEVVIIVVSAELVADVLREAGELGIRLAIIITAGFREAGRQDLEDEIVNIAHQYGIRFMGPNIQGEFYAPNKFVSMVLFPSFTPGSIGIISQSGSITTAFCEWAANEGVGISAAINLGNQSDMIDADYLEYLGQDESTRVIAMYLEGVKDGERFLDAVKHVIRRKPIVMLKSGGTESGMKSAASHTGALAGNFKVFSAACRQFGVVQVFELEALYDAARGLAMIAPPRGNRLMVVSTSGGGNTLLSDAADRHGLTIPDLPANFKEKINSVMDLPATAYIKNPFDLVTLVGSEYARVMITAAETRTADVYLMDFADAIPGSIEAIKSMAAQIKDSFAVAFFGGAELEKAGRPELQRLGIPVFQTPERAIRAVAAAVWDSNYRSARGEAYVRA